MRDREWVQAWIAQVLERFHAKPQVLRTCIHELLVNQQVVQILQGMYLSKYPQ